MRAVAHHHHFVAALAPDGVVAAEDLDFECAIGDAVEDGLGVEGAVVVADAGVVAADDQMGATAVLAEDGVEHGLPGTGVEHVEAIAGDHHGIFGKVELDHFADRGIAHIGRDVPGLELAE